MIAIIGAIVFLVVIVLSILIICGLPLGELTMGGKYKVFPTKVFHSLSSLFLIFCFYLTHPVAPNPTRLLTPSHD